METGKQTILHIDDSEDSRKLTRRWLESAGYAVWSCDNASAAFDMLKKSEPDLILLDAMMPEMDGYQFCTQLQENANWARVPVVFMTALFSRQDKARAFAAGAVDFLVKPVRQERLTETVKKFLYASGQWNMLGTKRVSTGDVRGFVVITWATRSTSRPEQVERFSTLSAENLYSLASELVSAKKSSRSTSRVSSIFNTPAEIDARKSILCAAAHFVLPRAPGHTARRQWPACFCRGQPAGVETSRRHRQPLGSLQKPRIIVTEPRNIVNYFGAAAAVPAPRNSMRVTAQVASTRKRFESATMQEI